MKGIILAGGSGSRLFPLTQILCKQLLPIYDKPLIYYSLSTLMLAGIKDILIISTPKDMPFYVSLFKNGNQLGLNIQYEIQLSPKGIADAFNIGRDFIGDDNVCLILGDNIFYGHGLSQLLREKTKYMIDHAVVFGYYVNDPERYGVIVFDKETKDIISIEEKPKVPKSNYAVVGLYMYDNNVVEMIKELKPSNRGELEITDLNNLYLKNNTLELQLLGRGIAWLDTGTPSSMLEAAIFIRTIDERQGFKIGCIEEVAYNQGFINKEQLAKLANNLKASDYGKYLQKITEDVSYSRLKP